jgi:uncharacterized delta-60 repeat protein
MLSRRPSPRRALVATSLAAVFALAGQGLASAAPGAVDVTFGDAGAKTVPVGGSAAVAGVVQRADGTFVIGASVGTYAMTVALKRNGQLLMGYGSGGISSFPIPNASSLSVSDVAKQPNGRVVIAGWLYANHGSDRFWVARFRKKGGPDASFSGDGLATISFPQGDAYGYGVAIQPGGKIVVVGEVDPASGVSNAAIARLNPNGTLDRSFGRRGRVVVKVPDGIKGYDAPWRVAVTPLGRLVMAGWVERKASGNYRTLAMRLLPNGARDHSFGGDGIVVVDADGIDNWSYGLALDGAKPVLGLHLQTSAAGILRLKPNGARDRSFGGDGVAAHMLADAWEVSGVAVLPDHRIVASNGLSGGPDVARFKPGGKLDKGFGAAGMGAGPLTDARALGLVVTSARKIVVAGTSTAGDVMAARFLGP